MHSDVLSNNINYCMTRFFFFYKTHFSLLLPPQPLAHLFTKLNNILIFNELYIYNQHIFN